MKTKFTFLFLIMFTTFSLRAQFDFSQVKYWIGTGTDTSMLVIDFQDGSFDPSYAWGYLHNSGATAQDMLVDIAAADTNLSVAIGSGFLNDIIYNTHSGIGGSPDYWSTWSGTSTANFAMNAGITTVLTNGDWFGCSYTDFSPALAPTEPIAAFEPFYFTMQDITYWIGTGTDTAMLVIDFQDGSGASSFAWGYIYSGVKTGEDMLNDIEAADVQLNVATGSGFLNDIIYNTYSGIGGAPDYWSTWSATNFGNWSMNMGISTVLNNGDLFGCSYTDFSPALRPGYPAAATISTGIANQQAQPALSAYPSPATDVLHISSGVTGAQKIMLSNIAGELVMEMNSSTGTETIDVSELPSGIYILQVGETKKKIVVQ